MGWIFEGVGFARMTAESLRWHECASLQQQGDRAKETELPLNGELRESFPIVIGNEEKVNPSRVRTPADKQRRGGWKTGAGVDEKYAGRIMNEEKKVKALCLGAAGKISRESTLDLVEHSDFEKITVGDYNEEAGREVVAWLNDPRVDFRKINIRDKEATIRIMKEYDLVMDGTTISLNDLSTACIAEAGCHGINLNGFGAEYKYDALFKKYQRTCVPGFGMTPGTTNMMAKHAADQMDTDDYYDNN